MVTPSGMAFSDDSTGAAGTSEAMGSSASGDAVPSPDKRPLTSSPWSPMIASKVSTAAV